MLTTVQSLAFEPNSFAPFLTSTVPQLIQLMGEADTLESKRRVDECLNIIIERSGALVSEEKKSQNLFLNEDLDPTIRGLDHITNSSTV